MLKTMNRFDHQILIWVQIIDNIVYYFTIVYVGFVVNENGQVVDAKVLRPVAKLLDKEALRLVTKDVKFTPGYHEGKPVPVKMVLPIRFRL